MNKAQLNQAKTFALRLVGVAYDHRTKARQERLCVEIDFFFDCLGQHGNYRRAFGWDQGNSPCLLLCDYFDEMFSEEHFHEKEEYAGYRREVYCVERANRFFTDLRTCIRAAIDVACPEQDVVGVIGFTAGEIRRLYPRGIPRWLQRTLGETTDWDGKNPRPFSALPDEAVLAL